MIEHLSDPAAHIQHTLKLLKPGGLLILTCPNGQGFDIETLGPISASVDHEHLNSSIPIHSASAAIERHGASRVVHARRFGCGARAHQGLVGFYTIQGQPFLRKTLIDEWDQLTGPFQTYLVENGPSSNPKFVARQSSTPSPSE